MAIPVSSSTNVMPVESSKSAVSWGAIIAGAVAASAITVVLLLVGSGLGLAMVSPFSGESSSLVTIGAATAVWLIIVQWLSAGLGGYLTGRLRTKWVGIHTDEVFFRDTAHGFLGWALGTLLVAGVLSSAVSSAIGVGVQATATAAGATGAAGIVAASQADPSGNGFSVDYFTDSLLRPANPAAVPAGQADEQITAQVSRILVNGAVDGTMPDADKAYLSQVVATRTGLTEADARTRVDATLATIEETKVAAQEAADTAKKTATTVSLIGALSLLVGAFIASVAAALGGRQRDEEEDLMVVR
ncbi:hypothetical protein HFC70_17125 [Agrobacterium sp. a22-2]|uniref:hypothetical protein n=1 Tax=Agrobacterium sp. a22-2 TaxID=2283840 RepID=UPI0014450DDB|nr:hypothetical protein [Agrobacterium sp. a22-2]NKN38078.1 hypothetical protein [Agrobacterium sp. a22-2]